MGGERLCSTGQPMTAAMRVWPVISGINGADLIEPIEILNSRTDLHKGEQGGERENAQAVKCAERMVVNLAGDIIRQNVSSGDRYNGNQSGRNCGEKAVW